MGEVKGGILRVVSGIGLLDHFIIPIEEGQYLLYCIRKIWQGSGGNNGK
jgi:hypothetical protein